MDKDSFFNLFLEFNSRFSSDFPQQYMSVRPYCICIESECFNNRQFDMFISFFFDHDIQFSYSCYYIQSGVRLIFTFNVD